MTGTLLEDFTDSLVFVKFRYTLLQAVLYVYCLGQLLV